jgi:glycosyltransferase involved in cell wall biosynthesis
MKKLYIHAPNVHQGGGRTLLDALLRAVKGNVVLSVDDRMPLPADIANNIQVRRVKPSILQRFMVEKWLAQAVKEKDIVLSFGNLPPLFRMLGHTVVFVQNRYLIEDVPLNDFSLKIRLRLTFERLWLARRLMNADKFVVQTPTMKTLLEAKAQGKMSVSVIPFVAAPTSYTRDSLHSMNGAAVFDFVYVASGEPHKNHRRLIEAWCFLAKEGLFPSLCLTLNELRFAELCGFIGEMRLRYSVKITNVGELSHHDVLALYKQSGAAIYPSKFESFGLPLIEARQASLPVLASELDYVRDVLDPEQAFDPDSPTSIARAVKRFMGVNEKPLPLLDAAQFLEFVLKKDMQ